MPVKIGCNGGDNSKAAHPLFCDSGTEVPPEFVEIFNQERPHEALSMKFPAEVYQPSPRTYTGPPDID